MIENGDTYTTIAAESRGVYREKASKFIAVAMPVADEEQVKMKLEVLRKEFYDANHHCYAYRFGNENKRFRFNDDGEPSGSAGRPIYGQILSKDVSDLLVVVIRYFGGTKLGIPGLIHAYKTAAREALDKATLLPRTITTTIEIRFGFIMMNDVMRILKDEGLKIIKQSFDDRCTIFVAVARSRADKVTVRLNHLSDISTFKHT
jgi:uncharacterized YigZ family protein